MSTFPSSIPAEAVEAAAKALRDKYAAEVTELPVSSFLGDAQTALEAAAPHMRAPVQRPSRGWIAKNRNADGSVSIIGHFRDEGEAQKYADMWPASFVERAS